MWETWVRSVGWEDPLGKGKATHSNILALRIPWTIANSQTRLSDFHFFGGFTSSSIGKESACNSGDLGSIHGLGRSSGEGNVNPLQYSCLENSMDRGAWWATIHGFGRKESDMTE